MKTGGKKHSPGWQVGAAVTSYTCVSCGRSIYGLGEDKDKWSKVKTMAGSIHTFKHPKEDIIVYGYKEKDAPDHPEYKEVRRYARMFARPPLVKANPDHPNDHPAVIEHFVLWVLTADELKKIKATRGNSALFVCPFEGCHTVADADIQASVVIALRGYLYLKEYYAEGVEKPYTESRNKLLKDTLDLLKKLRITGRKDFIYDKKTQE